MLASPGSDTEILYRPRKLHGLAKPSRILSEREAQTEFQDRPHIVDTDTIADTLFADAVSETPTSGCRGPLPVPLLAGAPG